MEQQSNLLELLQNSIEKSGLYEKMKPILENEEVKKLSAIQVENETKNLFIQNLMNLESAKSNPQISAHFKQSYLGTIDNEILSNLRNLGFDEAQILEIQKENTTSKISKSLQKAIEKAKADAQKEGKQNESESILNLQKALEEAKTKATTEKESLKQIIDSLNNEKNEMNKRFVLENALNAFEYRNDLSVQDVKLIITNALNNELLQKKAKLVIENGIPTLKNAENDLLDYFDAAKGKVVTFGEFLNEVVANSKMLKVSQTNNNNNPNNNNNNPNNPIVIPPQKIRAGVAHLNNKLNQ